MGGDLMMDAYQLTHQLKGKWYHRYGTAPCPVCQPTNHNGSALTLRDGDAGWLLLHCKKANCEYREILVAAGITPGSHSKPNPANIAKRKAERQAQARRRSSQASSLWKEAQPIDGTPAETYLREARGITCSLPDTLRFHPQCWHGPTAKQYPALVAFVQGSDGACVHRTYLRADGTNKAALDRKKMMLGVAAGGAVKLTDGPEALVVAEGIETALSLASGLLRGPATIWAALSTSGIRALRLPDAPAQLTIAPDGDTAGRKAANVLADRAHALGWQVSLLPAPDGRDWNDILTIKGDAA